MLVPDQLDNIVKVVKVMLHGHFSGTIQEDGDDDDAYNASRLGNCLKLLVTLATGMVVDSLSGSVGCDDRLLGNFTGI